MDVNHQSNYIHMGVITLIVRVIVNTITKVIIPIYECDCGYGCIDNHTHIHGWVSVSGIDTYEEILNVRYFRYFARTQL